MVAIQKSGLNINANDTAAAAATAAASHQMNSSYRSSRSRNRICAKSMVLLMYFLSVVSFFDFVAVLFHIPDDHARFFRFDFLG